MKIAQMIFFKGDPVPPEHSYATKGQYNNQRNAQESKGIR
jgi:deoxycytidine triphosphate deaminase